MMGGQFSKTNDGGSSASRSEPNSGSPLAAVEMSKNPTFSAHLSSYETACTFDPTLQSFDAVLQARTSRVLGTLATGVEVRSMSFGSLREVTGCLLEMDQEVVKVILENKKDIRGSKEMSALVEHYFDSSIQTLEFCSSLEKCLQRAARDQLVVRAALSHFEEELHRGGADEGFDRTLRELARFRAGGDPFTEEFSAMFQAVLANQYSMLERLMGQKKSLDKKLRSLKTWRKVSNVVFVTAFVAVLICSVVAAAVAAPPVVTALLGALAIPVGSGGTWCSSLWNRFAGAVRGQRELVSSMQVGTFVTLKDLDNIRVLVARLEIKIQALMDGASLALEEEGSLEIVMNEIKKNLELFTETTEILSQQNSKCIQEITVARKVIVQRIVKHSSS